MIQKSRLLPRLMDSTCKFSRTVSQVETKILSSITPNITHYPYVYYHNIWNGQYGDHFQFKINFTFVISLVT